MTPGGSSSPRSKRVDLLWKSISWVDRLVELAVRGVVDRSRSTPSAIVEHQCLHLGRYLSQVIASATVTPFGRKDLALVVDSVAVVLPNEQLRIWSFTTSR
jgi:hypothetical protein